MGSTAVGSALKGVPEWVVISLGVATTLVSAVSLVLGSARMARLHDDLAKRFIKLECEMLKDPDASQEQLQSYCERRLEIEQDEPPVKRVLDILCHNELARAEGRADEYHVGFFQRCFAQFFDFFPDAIKKKPQGSPPPAPPARAT